MICCVSYGWSQCAIVVHPKFLAASNNAFQYHEFQIGAAQQQAGINEITFSQNLDPTFIWGVTDLVLAENDPSDIRLVRGATEMGEFGNNYNGATDPDGVISAGFVGTGEDLELTFDGFDIDFNNEVELFLNGNSLGFLDAGVNDGLEDYSLTLTTAQQQVGENTLEFRQQINTAFKWGVTDILIDDVFGT